MQKILVEQQLQTDRIMQKFNAMTEEFDDFKKKELSHMEDCILELLLQPAAHRIQVSHRVASMA